MHEESCHCNYKAEDEFGEEMGLSSGMFVPSALQYLFVHCCALKQLAS
jgi:hypothetical protein